MRSRNAGAKPVGTAALELLRIASGIPRYGQDIRERDLPQETEQQRALHFSKGCYIGQEIVERIRSRGNVHRKFTGFEVQGPLPALGAKIQADGKRYRRDYQCRFPAAPRAANSRSRWVISAAKIATPGKQVAGQAARFQLRLCRSREYFGAKPVKD